MQPTNELVNLILENYGPFGAVVAILWWRLNRLEERTKERQNTLDEDIQKNQSKIQELESRINNNHGRR